MMVFGCQTVPIGREKYVIRLVSLFVHMLSAAVDTLCELESDSNYHGARPGILASTCKSFRLLALQPQGEWKKWQWAGKVISYAPGMYLDHGYGEGTFRRWLYFIYTKSLSYYHGRFTGQ